MRRWMLLAAMGVAWGHDMWIEPTAFRPETGQIVGLKLRVGQELLGDAIPRSAQLIREFVAATAAGRQAVIGREGSDPAGFVRVAAPGLTVVGYNSKASMAELGADKFNAYLREEGLDGILAERAKRKMTGAQARELFSRCAKTLLATGAVQGSGDVALGFPLELVAERNPYVGLDSEAVPLRLTYEGKALAGALVVAINKLRPAEKVSARTDAGGRVRLRLGGDGMWMVKAVHMVPVAGPEADWASYWASLTFARGGK